MDFNDKMDFKMLRYIIIFSLTLLTACGPTRPSAPVEPPHFNELIKKADKELESGNVDDAFTLYQSLSESHPDYKAPWQQMAQIKFDANQYSEAITYATKLLELDALNQFAHSITAVSGLRLSSHSLSILRQENSLSGTVLSEATSLTEILQDNLGVKKIVEPVRKKKRKKKKKLKPKAPVSDIKPLIVEKAGSTDSLDDPFGALLK